MRKALEKAVFYVNKPNTIYDHEGREPYLSRYHLLRQRKSTDGEHPYDKYGRPKSNIVRPKRCSLVLHHFHKSDSTKKFHNHGWTFGLSFILAGGYIEERLIGDEVVKRVVKPFSFVFFRPHHFHRVELIDESCWTVLLHGPRKNEWYYKSPGEQEVVPWDSHVKLEKSVIG